MIYDDVIRSGSESTTTSDSYHEIKNRWHSAEDIRKVPKCNIQKQRLLQPNNQNDSTQELETNKRNSDKSIDKYTKHRPLQKVQRLDQIIILQRFIINLQCLFVFSPIRFEKGGTI